MVKPIGAKLGDERKIGERVHRIADRGQKPDDETDIAAWCERADGGAAPFKIDLRTGEPEEERWLVVPPLSTIEEGIARLRPPPANYDLRPEYAAETFPENLDYLRNLADEISDPNERRVVTDFLDNVQHPNRLDPKDFFYFRLGEYCVTQCY